MLHHIQYSLPILTPKVSIGDIETLRRHDTRQSRCPLRHTDDGLYNRRKEESLTWMTLPLRSRACGGARRGPPTFILRSAVLDLTVTICPMHVNTEISSLSTRVTTPTFCASTWTRSISWTWPVVSTGVARSCQSRRSFEDTFNSVMLWSESTMERFGSKWITRPVSFSDGPRRI